MLRQTAVKTRIIDIVGGKFFRQDGKEPNYLQTASGRKISRVRILATVVGKFTSDDGMFGSVVLDDGTETIRAKTFKTLKPIDFIKSLESGFPYLTAWSYFFKQRETTNMLLDDFSFKSTPAWEDLIQYHREGKAKLDIIPKGDECNYLICLADLFAYYTDIQLYNLRKLLLPSEIQEIYRDLGVDVEINFLGKKDLSKIKWTSSGNIDTSSYIHHPIVFILSDKKASIFSSTEAYDYLIAYATYNNAGLQFLQITDRKGLARIRDGDILVVIGENARKEASYWRNSFELELLTPLEIKKRMKDLVSR